MDTSTGKIYQDKETALQDLTSRGVSRKEAENRLIQGTMLTLRKCTMPTLRKLRKMIRKQIRSEKEKK